MKEITELQKSRVCKGQGTPSTHELNRFVPYSRGYRRGRGRGTRTSTYTSQSGYQQPEVNKKLTKAPNNWYVIIGMYNFPWASLDLKHAYYAIPVALEQRKFLKFLWLGNLYEFNVLPMGLSSSPRITTKVMKPPLAYLRQTGCTVSGYTDDFFIQGNDFRECYSSLEEAVLLFLQLGFHIHPEKSVLIPSQSLTFLGFYLNPVSMTVTLTQEKRDQLEPLCTEPVNGEVWSIRFVAKVIGKVVSALPGVEFGRLHHRYLERDKIYALSAKQGYYDAPTSLLIHPSGPRTHNVQGCLTLMA